MKQNKSYNDKELEDKPWILADSYKYKGYSKAELDRFQSNNVKEDKHLSLADRLKSRFGEDKNRPSLADRLKSRFGEDKNITDINELFNNPNKTRHIIPPPPKRYTDPNFMDPNLRADYLRVENEGLPKTKEYYEKLEQLSNDHSRQVTEKLNSLITMSDNKKGGKKNKSKKRRKTKKYKYYTTKKKTRNQRKRMISIC